MGTVITFARSPAENGDLFGLQQSNDIVSRSLPPTPSPPSARVDSAPSLPPARAEVADSMPTPATHSSSMHDENDDVPETPADSSALDTDHGYYGIWDHVCLGLSALGIRSLLTNNYTDTYRSAVYGLPLCTQYREEISVRTGPLRILDTPAQITAYPSSNVEFGCNFEYTVGRAGGALRLGM